MPSLPEIFGEIRAVLAPGVTRVVTTMRRDGGDGVLYARAKLDRAEISEEYFVEQDISENRWIQQYPASTDPHARPIGRITLSLPYDGCDYFTRQAIGDVAGGPEEPNAVIGHLLLQGYDKTDLGARLGLHDGHGSVRLEVPVASGSGEPGNVDHLSADQLTRQNVYQFTPDPPEPIPAQLEVELDDPDSVALPDVDLYEMDLRTKESGAVVRDIVRKIRQQVNFKRELVLRMVVHVDLASRARRDRGAADPAQPDGAQSDGAQLDGRRLRVGVTRAAVGWPSITSLDSVDLYTGAHPVEILSSKPVSYNPDKYYYRWRVGQRIEWENVPMRLEPGTAGSKKWRSYESDGMLLHIKQPGELYKQEKLVIYATVRISGYLLSGLEARLYDATGHRCGRQPELTTFVHVRAELALDDAFAKRTFSPYQQLFFDDIIPDDMRIVDIETALQDRGFEVHQKEFSSGILQADEWFLTARRQEGPDVMSLWIFVEGKRFTTVRETTAHGDREKRRTRLDSGELRVFVHGRLRRDSSRLTHEMNALREALHNRYEHVRQRR